MQPMPYVFDAPQPLPPFLPTLTVYPYSAGSPPVTRGPLTLTIGTMQERSSDSASSHSENGDENHLCGTLPCSKRVFRPIDFEQPASSKRFSFYESPTPTECDFTECAADSPVVTLQDREVWEQFYAAGNEMIVTKPGRRLFPPLSVSVRALNPRLRYEITLKVVPADSFRYKYINSTWIPVGESDILQNEAKQYYVHPSSRDLDTSVGDCWMKKPISFKNVKISHNPGSRHGDILVHTMHKYVMEIVVRCLATESSKTCVRLPETEFIAVTSYQNTSLTQLKIEKNPFAKGFREKESCTPFFPPQGPTSGYLPLRVPFCPRPLWQLQLSHNSFETKPLEHDSGSEMAVSALIKVPISGHPPQMITYPPQRCWPWSYCYTPQKQAADSCLSHGFHPDYYNSQQHS